MRCTCGEEVDQGALDEVVADQIDEGEELLSVEVYACGGCSELDDPDGYIFVVEVA